MFIPWKLKFERKIDFRLDSSLIRELTTLQRSPDFFLHGFYHKEHRFWTEYWSDCSDSVSRCHYTPRWALNIQIWWLFRRTGIGCFMESVTRFGIVVIVLWRSEMTRIHDGILSMTFHDTRKGYWRFFRMITKNHSVAGFWIVFEISTLQKWICRIRSWWLVDRHQVIRGTPIGHFQTNRDDLGD